MIVWILAGALIAGGYRLLWIGHTTDAAALLSIGYCIGVPAAILLRRSGGDAPKARVPQQDTTLSAPFISAAIVSAVVMILYLITLAPTTAMWDASEYMAAVGSFGLPHPPGNPLFIIVARAWSAIPLAPTLAMRVNLLAALASAATAGLWFLVAFDALRELESRRWARIAGACAASLLGATAFTVWNQSVVNEKVYTISVFQTVLSCWLALRWLRAPGHPRASGLLLLSVYLCGLGYAVHPAGFFALLPIGVAVVLAWMRAKRTDRVRQILRPVALSIPMLFLGLTPFAYEPIRSSHDPAMNMGEPTACAGVIRANCIFSAETLARLRSNVNREQFGKPSILDRQAPITAQVGMWWSYWRWQWFRDPRMEAPGLQTAVAVLALLLAGFGARAQWRADRQGFFVTAALVVTVTPVLIFYLNFKYGYAQVPQLGELVEREVRDRDYFFLWSFSALATWVGLGITESWRSLGARMGSAGLLRASPFLALALVPLAVNARPASRAGETFTREWARDVLTSAPPGAVLFTNGDNDTFPLWYAQQAEGYRRDVSVIVGTLLSTDWLPWQLARRIPEPYAAGADSAIWRGAPEAPRKPILNGTRAELDAIPFFTELRSAQEFQHGQIRAIVGPGTLTRDQVLLLRMIRDTFPNRPFVFTHPGFAASAGLGAHVVRTGLLWRLMPNAVQGAGADAKSPAGLAQTEFGPMDLAFSMRMWRDVYRGMAQLSREGDWVDEPSLSIPLQYMMLGNSLADALERQGAAADAASIRRDVEAIYRAARLDRLTAN
jgi:hypothetical protein